ncbi:MAG: alanine racemase [Clostridia bacterium]|nr:alanine racemase [Clostridia bacterium]
MNPSRVYVGVDLAAISDNVKSIMKKVGPDVKVMAVIKTDGYGHGAVAIAHALNEIGVYSFAVATIDEARELRASGIRNPILILGYVFPNDLQDVIDYNVTSTVFSYDSAKMISDYAAKRGKVAKIHIKLDTGMGRIGFVPGEESAAEIKRIFDLKNIEVEGVFTHFATADEADLGPSKAQAKLFEDFVNSLEADGYFFKIRHICNSAGVLVMDGNYDNMVRAGIIIYGLRPSAEVKCDIDLKPALELVSHVAYVKEVGAGFTVSYGSTYTTSGKTKIATIPVGYGDGYPRSLSNKGRVIVNGCYAPIIGRVCMDQFMVDVTAVPDVKQGDEVILIGKQGDCEITVDEIADIAGTINYEIVCGINKRVPRIFRY